MRGDHWKLKAEIAVYQIDQVAAWLDRRSEAQSWGLVAVSMVAVALLDFSTEAFELCIATLYIVPICLASWMFLPRAALTITAAITVTAFLKYPLLHTDPSVLVTLYNGTSRALAFALLTAIILAFRASYNQTRMAASRDPMTGILNKAAFLDRARSLLEMSHAAGHTTLLIYLDLDGFKAVNDRFGHHAGDRVLQEFAAGTARVLDRRDCFGRIGGDEFAVAAVIDSEEEVHAVANYLHARLSAVLAATDHAVTCSMGALAIPADNNLPWEELMRAADRLMYASKHSGKNALTVSTATRGTGTTGKMPRVRQSVQA